LYIASVRIHGGASLFQVANASNLRFPSLSPNLQIYIVIAEGRSHTRVPSPVRPFASVVVVVVFLEVEEASAIRESFNVQIIMMLYIVIHLVLEVLHGLHEPVFSFAQSRRWYIHVPTHSTLDPFYNTYL
jgi:hypothetical protein